MTGQAGFAGAILNAGAAVPKGLTDGQGRQSAKRFSVYRNNVIVSLTDALEVAFPVVRQLVGDEFFKAMAGVFVRSHPPRDRRLALYGATLPAFLEGFPPAADLPYLADVARLEQALRESYHAADAPLVAPQKLAGLAPDDLARLRLKPAPATRVFRSGHPVLSIWRRNNGLAETVNPSPQDVVVTRARFDPAPHLLPEGGVAFLQALSTGMDLGAAAEAVQNRISGAEVPTLISHLIANAALMEDHG